MSERASHSAESEHSTVNASRLVATFTDYDERTCPYEGRALKIALSSDVLFVYIGKLTEGLGSDKFEHDDAQSMGVDAEALYEALGAMLRRDDREAYERAREGTLPASSPMWGVQDRQAVVPAIRRRA